MPRVRRVDAVAHAATTATTGAEEAELEELSVKARPRAVGRTTADRTLAVARVAAALQAEPQETGDLQESMARSQGVPTDGDPGVPSLTGQAAPAVKRPRTVARPTRPVVPVALLETREVKARGVLAAVIAALMAVTARMEAKVADPLASREVTPEMAPMKVAVEARAPEVVREAMEVLAGAEVVAVPHGMETRAMVSSAVETGVEDAVADAVEIEVETEVAREVLAARVETTAAAMAALVSSLPWALSEQWNPPARSVRVV